MREWVVASIGLPVLTTHKLHQLARQSSSQPS